MTRTRIEWCSMTWNPITGCLHGCEYCYAKGIAKRFGGHDEPFVAKIEVQTDIYYPMRKHEKNKMIYAPYPFGFAPTFHRYRLDEPQKSKKPQTVFVGSMADMFGEWVPDEWIEDILKACKAAPWHKYLFLTKNPRRYEVLLKNLYEVKNMWFGSTITNGGFEFFNSKYHNTFLSIEPILSAIDISKVKNGLGLLEDISVNWVIVGAETKNGKVVNPPKKEWIEDIVEYCKKANVPVFLKSNIADIWSEPLMQEFPWCATS